MVDSLLFAPYVDYNYRVNLIFNCEAAQTAHFLRIRNNSGAFENISQLESKNKILINKGKRKNVSSYCNM